MRKILSALVLCLLSSASYAGSSTSGYITRIFYMGNGKVLFTTNGTHTGVPACGSGNIGRFAFDSTTAVGKSILAGLLAAYATGTGVTVIGTGDCGAWDDTESVSNMYSP